MTTIHNTDAKQATRPRLRGFFAALLSTGVPFLALFFLTVGMAKKGGELLWVASLALCLLALAVSAAFAIADKRRAALGILAGTAIGIVGLVVSCSTVLAAGI